MGKKDSDQNPLDERLGRIGKQVRDDLEKAADRRAAAEENNMLREEDSLRDSDFRTRVAKMAKQFDSKAEEKARKLSSSSQSGQPKAASVPQTKSDEQRAGELRAMLAVKQVRWRWDKDRKELYIQDYNPDSCEVNHATLTTLGIHYSDIGGDRRPRNELAVSGAHALTIMKPILSPRFPKQADEYLEKLNRGRSTEL